MPSESKRHLDFPFQIERAALLVIDMQRFFTNPSSHAHVPSSEKITININKLIELFSKKDRPIIFTRHIDTDMENMMNRWWGDSILETEKKSGICKKIDTSKGEIIIKHQYDAFLNTELEKKLRDKNVSQVVITGVVTHLCCETTARSAFMRNFETFFMTDATGSYDKEYHNASILNLSHGFAIPVDTKDIT